MSKFTGLKILSYLFVKILQTALDYSFPSRTEQSLTAQPPKEIDKDLYRMADVYHSVQFTLILLWAPAGSRRGVHGSEMDVTPTTLDQLTNRAYAGIAEESTIKKSVGEGGKALTAQETELQALARLSMANDTDRMIEGIFSSASRIPDTARWYGEEDEPTANYGTRNSGSLENVEPPPFGGKTSLGSLSLCDTHTSGSSLVTQIFSHQDHSGNDVRSASPESSVSRSSSSPRHRDYLDVGCTSARNIWDLWTHGTGIAMIGVGVKGLISAEDACERMCESAVFTFPGTSWCSPSALLAQTEVASNLTYNVREDDNLYALVDTIYYFRTTRAPTVCLYTGHESGFWKFMLCDETRCAINEPHKEAVIKIPGYIC
ncbi:hypothetical protein HD554DRAFT_2042250 [Boletus coccyginus]|nr:hypothetical protein HD554DRAFT_2042250 [Boletus coccyginus]